MTTTEREPDAADEGGFVCPHCGSSRLRRSAPHAFTERLVRAFTPYHYFRCRDCGRRGRYLGTPPWTPGGSSGRPIERRDLKARRKRRLRLLVWLVVSVVLGTAAAVYLHSCEEAAERAAPAPPP